MVFWVHGAQLNKDVMAIPFDLSYFISPYAKPTLSSKKVKTVGHPPYASLAGDIGEVGVPAQVWSRPRSINATSDPWAWQKKQFKRFMPPLGWVWRIGNGIPTRKFSVAIEFRGCILHLGVVPGFAKKFFGTKMALAPALGEPCACLARPQSRLSFCLSISSLPRVSARFRVVS